MSYELDQLMQQYGVSTPAPAYGGVAAPVKPTAPGPGATPEAVAAYNALVQKYNLDMPRSLADQAVFEQYKLAHQNKIGEGSIYNQAQFNTSGQPYTGAKPSMLAGPVYGSNSYGGQFSPLSEMAAPITPVPLPNVAWGGGGDGRGGDSGGGADRGNFGISNGTGSGFLGNTMVDGVSGPTSGIYSGMNSLAAVLGNMGLTTLSDSIAKNVDPNYSHEGRGAIGGGVDPGTGLQGAGTTGSTGTHGDAAAGTGMSTASGSGGGREGSSVSGGPSGAGGPSGGGGYGEGPGGGGGGGYDGGDPGGGGPRAKGGLIRGKYARGGQVRRNFAEGGLNDLAESYGLSGPPDVYQSAEMNRRLASVPQGAPTTMAPSGAPAAAVAAPELDMQGLLERYLPRQVDYSGDIAESRKALSGYTQNFNKLLEQAMTQKAAGPSKAELYFNLAAAFGTPGKTGNFFEQLGGAGKALAEHNKSQRELDREQQKTALALGMKQQEMGAESERSNLTTLRQLAAEGSKDQRAVVGKLLENYIQSGKPQSAAGKQAQDEGFQPGTPAFNKRVGEIGNMLVDKQMAQINAIVAGMGTQQGQLAVSQGQLGVAQGNLALKQAAQQKAAEAGTKLTPGEMKIKLETEDTINSSDQALADLEKAYALNPNTFDASMVDMAQRRMLEAVGSKDPKLLATREQENLLASQALAKLKAAFGGAPTEGERKIMLDLQGIGSKSIKEREIIIRNTARALQTARAKAQARLKSIAAGEYRTATPAPEPVAGE